MTDHTMQSGAVTLKDNSEYLISNALEIARTLRGLSHRNEMVSAFFNEGRDLLLTAVLDVQPENHIVMLDYGSNDTLNNHILKAEKIIFVTALDHVKIQWVSQHIALASFDGRPAFRIPMPAEILYLQHREYYRLATSVLNPLHCRIPSEQGTVVEIALADISAGGIGIILPNPIPETLKPEVGKLYPGCRIELPDSGTVEFTISIRSIWEASLRNGNKCTHAGCQFIDIRPGMQSMIQRYISKMERERISHMPGHS